MSNESNTNLVYIKIFTIIFILFQFLNTLVLITIDNNDGESDNISFILVISIITSLLFGLVIINLFGNKLTIWSGFTALALLFGEILHYFPTNIFIYPDTLEDFNGADSLTQYAGTFDNLRSLLPENLFQFYIVVALEIIFILIFLFLLNKIGHDLRIEFIIYFVAFFVVSYFFITSTSAFLTVLNKQYMNSQDIFDSEPNLILSRFLTLLLPALKGIVFSIFYYKVFHKNKQV